MMVEAICYGIILILILILISSSSINFKDSIFK